MKKILFLIAGLSFLTFTNQAQTVTDIDGNVYSTVTIGSQKWLKENLRVTHYRNGDTVQAIDPDYFDYTNAAGYINFSTSIINQAMGIQYNWYAVEDSRNLCPLGWHIPDTQEWNTLFAYLGGNNLAGGSMKDTGTTFWDSPNTGASNSSGFTGLPAGCCCFSMQQQIDLSGELGCYWSSTEKNIDSSYRVMLLYDRSTVYYYSHKKKSGSVVRCIYDSTNNPINNKNLLIYPNPATDKITVENPNQVNEAITSVFNIHGQLMMKQPMTQKKTELDISGLMNGIYILKISNNESTTVTRFIKE